MTIKVLSEGSDFCTLAKRLREVADLIECGVGNCRRGEDFDYEVTHGNNLDIYNRAIFRDKDIQGLSVAFEDAEVPVHVDGQDFLDPISLEWTEADAAAAEAAREFGKSFD